MEDLDIRAEVADAYHDEVAEGWSLFALYIERCLHARYRHMGDWPPTYTKWVDPEVNLHRERGDNRWSKAYTSSGDYRSFDSPNDLSTSARVLLPYTRWTDSLG